jgi:imidazolonepropionase-like amidohydrolase
MKNRISFLLLLTLSGGACLSSWSCSDAQLRFSTGIAIEDVSVIDVEEGTVREHLTVVAQGRRIVGIESASKILLGDSVETVDGTGRFLIPGLWDMHVHALDTDFEYMLPLFVANGVTGIRDMWGNLEVASRVGTDVEAGQMVSPRFVTPGNLVDGADPWWPESVEADTPERGVFVVDSLAATGASFIKVYSLLAPETYRAILRRAHEVGLPAAGHVPFMVSAAEASDLGQASMEHLFGVMEGCSRAEDSVRAERSLWLEARARGDSTGFHPFFDIGMYRLIVDGFDPTRCEGLLRRFADNRTWQVPTLFISRTDAMMHDSTFLSDPRLGFLSEDELDYWNGILETVRSGDEEDQKWQWAYYERELEITRMMADLGVPILPGTDCPGPFLFPGFSLHDELETLVEAGLSEAQTLRAATYEPAVFFGATDSLGTVEVGKLADLVLLEGNPLEAISNTRKIAAVVANGRLFNRDGLDSLFAEVRVKAGETEGTGP